jgi:hypothetical protein
MVHEARKNFSTAGLLLLWNVPSGPLFSWQRFMDDEMTSYELPIKIMYLRIFYLFPRKKHQANIPAGIFKNSSQTNINMHPCKVEITITPSAIAAAAELWVLPFSWLLAG